MCFFYLLNWVFLFALIWNVYKVRHIRDRLDIRKEMTTIIIVWAVFCLLQYLWYIIDQTDACHSSLTSDRSLQQVAYDMTYVTLIIRDSSVLLITIYFIVKVNNKEETVCRQLQAYESVHDVFDLSTVLYSVTPLVAFGNYLEAEHPSYLHLLKFVKMYRILEEQVQDLRQLEDEFVATRAKYQTALTSEEHDVPTVEALADDLDDLADRITRYDFDLSDVLEEISNYFIRER